MSKQKARHVVAVFRRWSGELTAGHDTIVVPLHDGYCGVRSIYRMADGTVRRSHWEVLSRQRTINQLARESRMQLWDGRRGTAKLSVDPSVDFVPKIGIIELDEGVKFGTFDQKERRTAMQVYESGMNTLDLLMIRGNLALDEPRFDDRMTDIFDSLTDPKVLERPLHSSAAPAPKKKRMPRSKPVEPVATEIVEKRNYPEILVDNRHKYVQLEHGRHYLRKMGNTGVLDLDMLRKGRESFAPVLMLGEAGTGKAVALDTPVLTPGGWTKAADVSVGDELIGSDGRPTKVLAVYPQPIMPMYRITFSDGVRVDANGEHLWEVMTNNDRVRGTSRVLTTDQIRAQRHKKRLAIPMLSSPVEYAPQGDLPMDPYALGVSLGDGCFTGDQAQLSTDLEILRSVGAGSVQEQPGCWFGTLQIPRDLGLRGKRSWEKHIPQQYMTAPPRDRIALLQGLLDTDASPARGKSAIEYSTSSPMLAEQVQELVQSLGGTARTSVRAPWYTYRGARLQGRENYRILVKLPAGIAPFRLERKARLHVPPSKYPVRRYIDSIDPIEDAHSVCFTVDARDSLFAIDGFVLTHNTQTVMAAFGEDNIITVLGHEEVEAASFEGRYVPAEGGGWKLVIGKLVRAMQEGKVLFIDEIGLISSLVLSILYSAMDGRRTLEPTMIPDIGLVKAEPGFYVVGATNPKATGARIADAMRSRFPYRPVVTTDYKMAVTHLGVPEAIASAGANLDERRIARELSWSPQTRDLVQFVQAVEDFNEDFALASLAGKAPESDQRTVCEVLSREVGRTVKPLVTA